MDDHIKHDHSHDGVDRRGFLKCMAWAGAGTLLVLDGGVLKSFALSGLGDRALTDLKGQLSFVQISDSHIGFNKAANMNVVGTLRAAIDKINALPTPTAFILHTGDLTHLSRDAEFDTLEQNLRDIRPIASFTSPANTMF